MNKAEFDRLYLNCGIDTFEITTDIKLVDRVKGVTTKTPLQACESHGFLYKYKVNPDTVLDGAGNNIDKFKQVLEYVKECFKGASELYISRVDYRFDDCFNEYSDRKFYKINRALLSMMTIYYGAKNRYTSDDLITGEKLTVRFDHDIKGSVNAPELHISGEYYNKKRDEPNKPIKTRLELRSRQVYIPFLDGCDYESFLLADWLERLDEVLTAETFNKLLDVCTTHIKARYAEEKEEFGNFTEFIASHRYNIYTSRQLTNLYKIDNPKTAKSRANKYRTGNRKDSGRKIDFFSLANLQEYKQKLVDAAYRFFDTQTTDSNKKVA